MAKYEVDINGTKYEVDAPDEQSLGIAVKQLQEQEPAAATRESPLGMPSNAGRAFSGGVANMAMLGFADEAAAGLAYLRGQLPGGNGKPYSEILPLVREQQGIDIEEHPVANLAGMGVGIIPSVMALGPAAASRPTLAGQVGVGAATGGGLGAAQGFGTGEGGFVPRAQNAAVQGGIGAAVGGAVPLVANAAGATYRGVRDWMAQNAAARQAGANPAAVQRITELLAADDTLGTTGRANIARAGPDAMLADAGPNAQQALDAAVQFGGRGTIGTRQAIDARAGRAADDMTAALDLHLGGPPVGVETARAGIRTAARPALNEAYDAAYSLPINYADDVGQRLEGMVKNRVPQGAIQAANNLMRTEGAQSQQILAHVDDAGNVVFERMPDVRQIDYITRGLRQMAESGEGAGALGGQTQLGAAYQNLARDLRTTLREAVPEYGNALDTAADPISRSQAIRFGSNVLNKGITRDEVAREAAGMSVAERQAAAQGIRSQIDEQMSNVQRALTDPNMDAREAVAGLKTLSSRATREKVAHIIGDDAAAQLFGDIDRAAMSFDLRAAIANNSKTFTRGALDEGITADVQPGALRTLGSGKPLKAGQRLAETIMGTNPQQLYGAKQDIYAEIADLLTRPAGQAIPAFNAMTDSAARQALNQVQADRIRALIGATSPASYPVGAPVSDRLSR